MKGITYAKLCLGTCLLMAIMACKQENCPGTPKVLDVIPAGPLFVSGAGISEVSVALQYPTDCDLFPYRGNLTFEILEPDGVPGANLYLEQEGERGTTWTNGGITSQSGVDSVKIFLVPDTINGTPSTLVPGTYPVRLRANFDEPEDLDEVILQVEVLDGNLSMFILSPLAGNFYAEGTDSVRLEALISDQAVGVDSVGYRLDGILNGQVTPGNWVYQTYASQAEVTVDELLSVADFPNYFLHLRAVNSRGEATEDSVAFAVEKADSTAPTALTVIFWDGEGDGFRWSDPQNWVGDMVPDERHKAVIRMNQVDTVVIAPTGTLQEVYRVGAIDLLTNVQIESGAILQIESSIEVSQIWRSLTFKQNTPDPAGWAAIRFEDPRFGQNQDTILLSVNLLFLSGARFEAPGLSGGKIISSSASHNPFIYDEVPTAFLSGGVNYNPQGNVTMEESFTFEYQGGSWLINDATWRINGGLTLRQDSSFTSYSSFVNRRFLYVSGATTGSNNAVFLLNGRISFTNIDGFVEVENKWGNQPSKSYFYSNASNRLGVFNTDGDIFLYYGNWWGTATSVMRARNIFVGSRTERKRNPPIALFEGIVSDIERIVVERGKLTLKNYNKLNSSINRYHKIEVGREGSINTRILIQEPRIFFIDSLLLGNRAEVDLLSGDTLITKKLAWDDARIDHDAFRWNTGHLATIVIQSNNFRDPSRLQLGGNSTYFPFNLIIESDARFEWLKGHSFLRDTTLDATLTVQPRGQFVMNLDQDRQWGIPPGEFNERGNRLSIYNYGEVIKLGSGNIDIYGCLSNRDNGSFSVQGGSVDFVGNVSCD